MARFDTDDRPPDPRAGDSRAVLASDTSRASEEVQIALWRRMSPVDKARAVSEISRAVQELSLAGIRRRHPGASERECMFRLAILKLGRTLACRVYPDAASLIGPRD